MGRRRQAGSAESPPVETEALPPGATFLDQRTVEERRRAFLDALRGSFTATAAAAKAGIDRGTPYKWRRGDAEFARAWDEALAEGRELTGAMVEDELLDQAINQHNTIAGFFIAKGIYPGRYRDNAPIPHQQPAVQSIRFLTPEESRLAVEGEYRVRELLPPAVPGHDDKDDEP